MMIVSNRQREIVYSIRNDVLLEEEPSKIIFELVEEELDSRLAVVPIERDLEKVQPECRNSKHDCLLGKCYLSALQVKLEEIRR